MERSCGPMNKKRIEGIADQGERAKDREALVTKRKQRRSGGRAVKECVSCLGRSRLMPERATVLSRSEKSAEAVLAGRDCKVEPVVKGRTRRSVRRHVDVASTASDACASRAARGRTR